MLTVASVYVTGGCYDEAYVKRLAMAVQRNLTVPYRFVCLTDAPSESLQIPAIHWIKRLRAGWPGWWAKMEIFRLRGPVLYFDLDTIITGSIDLLAKSIMQADDNTLLMLRDFYSKRESSGILGWHLDMSLILQDFRDNYAADASWHKGGRVISMRAKGTRFQGDQDWLRIFLRSHPQIAVTMAQDVQPGLYSYKVDVQKAGGLPDDASIVCFHGEPRPHGVKPCPEWMLRHWHGANIAEEVREQGK